VTEDHFPPASLNLPGDPDNYPGLCPECERHVRSSHGHARDCPRWRGNQD